MFKYRAPTRFAAAVIFLFYSQLAHAGYWQICNRTQQQLYVAIAYAGPPGPGIADLLSQGWWTAKPCGCVTVLPQRGTSVFNEGYLYAENANKVAVISGENGFCVDTARPFRYSIKNVRCTQRNFRKVQVNLNKSPWTTYIDGQPACVNY